MAFDDLFELGYVERVHGLDGSVVIFLDVDNPVDYKDLESILLSKEGDPIPFFVGSSKMQGDRLKVKFEGINDRDSADELKSMRAYLPLSKLPKLKEGQFYYHDIIGFEVMENGRKIGMVQNVFSMPGDDLISMNFDGQEALIPINDDIVQNVNLQNKTIEVNLPEGLLDIYR